jgi:hypothetical protein
VTGRYRSSEGKVGEEVWGTRARWMVLTGIVQGEPVTLAILDHPQNYGHPTHWHARGYRLFAANPLGQAAFAPEKATGNDKPPINQKKLTLEPGQAVTFRHRILILSGKAPPMG